MGGRPQLVAPRVGTPVEVAVRGRVWQGIEEISGAAFGCHPLDLLRSEAGAGEMPVGEPRRELVAHDCLDRTESNDELAPAMVRRPVDRLAGDLRLEDRWHRLR